MKPELSEMKKRLGAEIESARRRPALARTIVHGAIGLIALWMVIHHFTVEDIEHLTGLLGLSGEELRVIIMALLVGGGLEGFLHRKRRRR